MHRARRCIALLAAAGLWIGSVVAVAAGQGAPDVPGDFDFYVLVLSWSPSYCAAAGDRADQFQCAGERPYRFVVHGLWPQYERGWPQYCKPAAAQPTDTLVRSMLDIMPSPTLVRHEWDRHGTCSGISVEGYFDTLRLAREKVTIPPAFESIDNYEMVSPADVEAAFRAANPGIASDAIAVTCDSRRLREVRICLTRSLEYRACEEVDRKSCRLDRAVMPPARGG